MSGKQKNPRPAKVQAEQYDQPLPGFGYWCPGWRREGHEVAREEISSDSRHHANRQPYCKACRAQQRLDLGEKERGAT